MRLLEGIIKEVVRLMRREFGEHSARTFLLLSARSPIQTFWKEYMVCVQLCHLLATSPSMIHFRTHIQKSAVKPSAPRSPEIPGIHGK